MAPPGCERDRVGQKLSLECQGKHGFVSALQEGNGLDPTVRRFRASLCRSGVSLLVTGGSPGLASFVSYLYSSQVKLLNVQQNGRARHLNACTHANSIHPLVCIHLSDHAVTTVWRRRSTIKMPASPPWKVHRAPGDSSLSGFSMPVALGKIEGSWAKVAVKWVQKAMLQTHGTES